MRMNTTGMTYGLILKVFFINAPPIILYNGGCNAVMAENIHRVLKKGSIHCPLFTLYIL